MEHYGHGDKIIMGQLGLNNLTQYSSPVQLPVLHGVIIFLQIMKVITLSRTDGTLWSWGYNTYGQLGQNNTEIKYSSPVQVGTDTTWSKLAVASAHAHNLMTKTDGTLWSMGWLEMDK